jgi:prepilin-type N-terminal cleavage/methylation domain-containing protein
MTQSTKQAAFSLIEVSIALVIVALVVAGALPMLIDSFNMNKRDETIERLEAIEQALLNYYAANGKALPCPSDITAGLRDSDFGVATAYSANSCSANQETTDASGINVAFGGVPVRTLDLPDEYALDGWGRRFSYHVTINFAAGLSSNNGEIIINDTNEQTRVTDAVFAVVSHGQNGHGGYTSSGTARYDKEITNAEEHENCDCDDDADWLTGSNDYQDRGHILIQSAFTPETSVEDQFDDIVTYMGKGLMNQLVASPSFGSSSFECPSDFSLVESSGGVKLGCIQTEETLSRTCKEAMFICMNTYGAKLPTYSELLIAKQQSLVTPSNGHFVDSASYDGTDSFCGIMWSGGTPGMLDWSTQKLYRCWIPYQ